MVQLREHTVRDTRDGAGLGVDSRAERFTGGMHSHRPRRGLHRHRDEASHEPILEQRNGYGGKA